MVLGILMAVAGTVTVAFFVVTLLLTLLFRAGFQPSGRLRRLIVAFLLAERFPRADRGRSRVQESR